MNAAEQILGSEKINNSKKAELRQSQSGIQVRTLNIRVRSIEKKYNTAHRVYQFQQNKIASPCMDVKVLKDKCIS